MNKLLKLSKRLMLSSLAMLTYAGCVEAQTYLCIADMATGFWFNKSTKKWETAEFDVAEEKYVLKGNNNKWTWIKIGEGFGETCGKGFTDAGYFRCDGLSIIYMNRNNLRFQVTKPTGFPDSGDFGWDQGAITPFIEIGKCAAM
jgi:hypothetical protein